MKYSTMIYRAAAWLEVLPRGQCGDRVQGCLVKLDAVDSCLAREVRLASRWVGT